MLLRFLSQIRPKRSKQGILTCQPHLIVSCCYHFAYAEWRIILSYFQKKECLDFFLDYTCLLNCNLPTSTFLMLILLINFFPLVDFLLKYYKNTYYIYNTVFLPFHRGMVGRTTDVDQAHHSRQLISISATCLIYLLS
jgi:hypothetical protein